MSALELKIPPVIIVLICIILMWYMPSWVPAASFFLKGELIITIAFALLGIAIAAAGVLSFKKANTTVNPTKPDSSSSLVTNGIYQRTRNPMYLGFLMLLISCFFWISNLANCVVLIGYVAYMNRFQILPEERALTNLFGQEFQEYTQHVGRWI